MEIPFFDYSPIVRRPRLELPNGARVAFWIGVNIEHFTFGQPALSLAQFTSELVPDPLNYGWRDYAPRVGVWRVMKILDKFGIRASAIVNADVLERYPEIVEEASRRQWAWVGHGQNNSTWHTGMEEEQERAFLANLVQTFERAGLARPKGWLGPSLTATMNTNDLLAEMGFTYVLDWANDDQPYPMNVRSNRLISVPYSSEVNDVPIFVIHHQTGEDFYRAVVDQFDALYAEGAESGTVMGIGIHPFLIGQPFRARYLERALEHIRGHDAVWVTTSDEIADWYLQTH